MPKLQELTAAQFELFGEVKQLLEWAVQPGCGGCSTADNMPKKTAESVARGLSAGEAGVVAARLAMCQGLKDGRCHYPSFLEAISSQESPEAEPAAE